MELKKHVAVIHSNNKLSLLQRKIANALLFNAYRELLDKDEHSIHIAVLCKAIGYGSNDYKTIKKALVNLLATVLEWNLVDGARIDQKGEIWNASSIISDASINGPICTYSYSNKMRQLLYHPDLYGRIDLYVQSKFKSTYGLALYETCCRFQNLDHSPWIDINTFRRLMGVEDDKYKVFRDFKSRVLDKALEEVNQYSPLRVEAHLRRVNQKVIDISFTIRSETVITVPRLPEHSDIPDILKTRFGFSKRQIELTLEQYEPAYIAQKIAMIEASKSYRAGRIQNLAKYLLKALQDDYQPPKASKELEQLPANNMVDFSDHARKQKVELEHEYSRFLQKEVMKLVDQLPPEQLQTLVKKFEAYMKRAVRGIYTEIYRRDGLANPLIKDQLYAFIRKEQLPILAKVKTFEEWVRVV